MAVQIPSKPPYADLNYADHLSGFSPDAAASAEKSKKLRQFLLFLYGKHKYQYPLIYLNIVANSAALTNFMRIYNNDCSTLLLRLSVIPTTNIYDMVLTESAGANTCAFFVQAGAQRNLIIEGVLTVPAGYTYLSLAPGAGPFAAHPTVEWLTIWAKQKKVQ